MRILNVDEISIHEKTEFLRQILNTTIVYVKTVHGEMEQVISDWVEITQEQEIIIKVKRIGK